MFRYLRWCWVPRVDTDESDRALSRAGVEMKLECTAMPFLFVSLFLPPLSARSALSVFPCLLLFPDSSPAFSPQPPSHASQFPSSATACSSTPAKSNTYSPPYSMPLALCSRTSEATHPTALRLQRVAALSPKGATFNNLFDHRGEL